MRRTATILAGLTLASVTILGVDRAGANTDPVPPDPAATVAPITSTDTLPSCSLYPTRNADGTVTFTNHNHERRFLQVFDVDGRMIFGAGEEGWLEVSESTGPLTGVNNVIWSGHAYPLTAYALVAWCTADEETTTTTAAPPPTTTPPVTAPPTTAPPVTSTTESFLPPATVPTPTTEPTTPPPVAPPADVTEDAIPVGVEAVVETREPLPVTGGHPGVLVLLGASLMVMGAAVVTAGRYRKLAR